MIKSWLKALELIIAAPFLGREYWQEAKPLVAKLFRNGWQAIWS